MDKSVLSGAPQKPAPPPLWKTRSPHSLLNEHEAQKEAQSRYAGFFVRLLASLIDSFIISAVSGAIAYAIVSISGSLISDMDNTIATNISRIPAFLLGPAYFIYFTSSSGQTFGKKALKIKVVKKGTTTPPNFTSAFLREIIGKIISAVFLGLGYLWIIGDKKKQAWHDKIAGTVVIGVGN